MFKKGDFIKGVEHLEEIKLAKVIGFKENDPRIIILEDDQKKYVGEEWYVKKYFTKIEEPQIRIDDPELRYNLGRIIFTLRRRKLNMKTILLKREAILKYMKEKGERGIYLLAWTFCGKKGAGLPAMKIENFVKGEVLEITTKVYETEPVPAHISGDWCTPWLTRQCKSVIGLSTQKVQEEDYPYVHIITLLEIPPLSLQ